MLIRKVEKFLREHDMPATKFGRLAAHDPRFVLDLRMGRIPREATEQRTRQWMADLSGRRTHQPHTGSASWYQPGDFSNPHTDWGVDRSVAYVWHLSRDWLPEYGGALYWSAETRNSHHAYVPASFNTLMLFCVTRHSSHMVTVVAPHVPSHIKRLAWNGWWRDDTVLDWYNDNNAVNVEGVYDSYEARLHLTADQSESSFRDCFAS